MGENIVPHGIHGAVVLVIAVLGDVVADVVLQGDAGGSILGDDAGVLQAQEGDEQTDTGRDCRAHHVRDGLED